MSASRNGTEVAPLPELPSGTVTFVFTDIEGSTQRWERDRAAMQAAVRRHDALMRAAIAAHNGRVFKTIGDAFCAAFSRPEDAVAAMLEVQQGLASEDFSAVDGVRARAAIHTGTADERDDDYFGPAVNRVARLLAIGHGAQVLVSGATAELVRGVLPAGATLRDLGEHRLKDIAQTERVYQLLAPELPSEFPALRSVRERTNNLPRVPTSFVGRETEIGEILELLERHRLVSIVGSGGVGKTRTSLQVASSVSDDFADGVWFVELAPLTSGEYIASTIAQALGLPPSHDSDRNQHLARTLKSKHLFLIFDNCEHLVEPAGRIIAELLRNCPQVTILASSRQSLGIAGEATYRLPSLEADAALRLFAERGSAVDKRFVLDAENAPIVAEICTLIDCIPLAIELAAARVKMLSPTQLRDRLDERFRVLTGGSRDALPRQQTLRALIDWSYELLDERERALFRRLGIFVNGFRLEGAVAVGSDAETDDLDVFDLLASLVDKSLVLAEPQGDAIRYRLLKSTRAYAIEKLDFAGEREAIAARHVRYLRNYFADIAVRYESHARGVEKREVLISELEDVRAALDGALGSPEILAGAELLVALGTTWPSIGLDVEGITRTEAYVDAVSDVEPRLRACLSSVLAHGLLNAGRKTQAFDAAARAVQLARVDGDPSTLAWALRWYAVTGSYFDRFEEAEAAIAEAEKLETSSVPLRLGLLETRGMLHLLSGDHAAGARVFEQIREQHRGLGNPRAERAAATNVAECEHARGETQRAIAILREVIPAARDAEDESFFLLKMLQNLTGYLLAVDDLAGAAAIARETIDLATGRTSDRTYSAIAIEYVAIVLALEGNLELGAVLEGYADAEIKRNGYERESSERATHERLADLLRDGLEPSEIDRKIAFGAGLTEDQARALASL